MSVSRDIARSQPHEDDRLYLLLALRCLVGAVSLHPPGNIVNVCKASSLQVQPCQLADLTPFADEIERGVFGQVGVLSCLHLFQI